MSALIELLNTVRRSAHVGWLTPSQRSCYDAVVTRARVLDPVILLGPPGSGKTLIGWLLRRELGFDYVASPSHLPFTGPAQLGVILDNAELAGAGGRVLLGQVLLRGWITAVIVARVIKPEGLPTVHLPAPSESDVIQCLANLPFPLNYSESVGDTNLWRVLRHRLGASVLGGENDA